MPAWTILSFKVSSIHDMSGTRSRTQSSLRRTTLTAPEVRDLQKRFEDGMRNLEEVSGGEGAPFRADVRTAIDHLHRSPSVMTQQESRMPDV
jgi:hypothetical protein